MDIQKLKDDAFLEAVRELKQEFSKDLSTLRKLEIYENAREREKPLIVDDLLKMLKLLRKIKVISDGEYKRIWNDYKYWLFKEE